MVFHSRSCEHPTSLFFFVVYPFRGLASRGYEGFAKCLREIGGLAICSGLLGGRGWGLDEKKMLSVQLPSRHLPADTVQQAGEPPGGCPLG